VSPRPSPGFCSTAPAPLPRFSCAPGATSLPRFSCSAAATTSTSLATFMEHVKQSLCPHDIALGLDVHGKTEMLRAVAALIKHSCTIEADPIFRALDRREQAGSTGVGNGLAIPHARIPGIDEPVTMFVRTNAPIPYGAPDGKPVSEFFVILVPAEGANETHLQLLRAVAELFSAPAFRARLAAATSAPAVVDAFASWTRGFDDGAFDPLQGLS